MNRAELPPTGISRPQRSGGYKTISEVENMMKAAAPTASTRVVPTPRPVPENTRTVNLPGRENVGEGGNRDIRFISVDGGEYVFRKRFRKDDAGKSAPLAYVEAIEDLVTLVATALGEWIKGGDPIRVFEAFRVNINDSDKQKFFEYRRIPEYRRATQQNFDEVDGAPVDSVPEPNFNPFIEFGGNEEG